MTRLSDYLQQRTADLSVIPVNSQIAQSLPSTYYNGNVLHPAGVTSKSAADRYADISARDQANNQTVANIVSQRKQAKAAADALAEAQEREAQANQQIADAQDSYDIKRPTKHTNNPYKVPKGSRSPVAVSGGDSSLYSGTTAGGYKVTGNHANTSGAYGAIGGVKGSGTYKYVYNKGLTASRNKVLGLATNYLGTTYVLGGESHSGIDCSGLVQLVYTQMGYKIPTHSAADQGGTGGRGMSKAIPGVRTSVRNLQPGDIVAWKDGSHIAIYAGNGYIIESTRTGTANRGTIYRKLWAPESSVIGIHLNLPGDAGYSDDHRK